MAPHPDLRKVFRPSRPVSDPVRDRAFPAEQRLPQPGRFEAYAAGKRPHAGGIAAALVLQFGVALYGGYFGAGIGILMLATMGLLGLHHIHEMNAIKTVLGALINIVAAAYFVFAGLVIWPQALVMTLGATLGYFLGSHMAQKISQQQVRHLVGIIGVSLSLVFFWREFLAR